MGGSGGARAARSDRGDLFLFHARNRGGDRVRDCDDVHGFFAVGDRRVFGGTGGQLEPAVVRLDVVGADYRRAGDAGDRSDGAAGRRGGAGGGGGGVRGVLGIGVVDSGPEGR